MTIFYHAMHLYCTIEIEETTHVNTVTDKGLYGTVYMVWSIYVTVNMVRSIWYGQYGTVYMVQPIWYGQYGTIYMVPQSE